MKRGVIKTLENSLPFMGDRQRDVFNEVLVERYRQDNKWGKQNHAPERWVTILGEEFGEFCEAVNETIFSIGFQKGYESMKKEAIQIAAVAVAFLEYIERRYQRMEDEEDKRW